MRLVARRNEKRSVQCQKSGRSSSNGGVDTKEKGSEERKGREAVLAARRSTKEKSANRNKKRKEKRYAIKRKEPPCRENLADE